MKKEMMAYVKAGKPFMTKDGLICFMTIDENYIYYDDELNEFVDFVPNREEIREEVEYIEIEIKVRR